MAPRSSADLRSVVAATLQRKSITLSVIGAACSEYELKCDGQRLEHIGYSGRGEAPRAFERHTSGERDEAFEALEQNRPRLVPDIRVQKAQGRSQRGIDRGYLTCHRRRTDWIWRTTGRQDRYPAVDCRHHCARHCRGHRGRP